MSDLDLSSLPRAEVDAPTQQSFKRQRVETGSPLELKWGQVLVGWEVPPLNRGQRGCADVALHPSCDQVVRSHYWQQSIDVMDLSIENKHATNSVAVRSIHTPLPPNAVTFLSPSSSAEPLVVAAEQNVLSIWDVRAGGRASCVHRTQVAHNYFLMYTCRVLYSRLNYVLLL